jgi:hypothetical protein
MAILTILWMGRYLSIRFPTNEAAYITAAQLFITPLPIVQFITDLSTKSIHTIGKDDDIEVKLYPGNLTPDMDSNTMIYLTPDELKEHFVFMERINMVHKHASQKRHPL